MLKLAGVNKKYNKDLVLNNINLEFDRGLYSLLGANGAGKSTIMKLLSTTIRPKAGVTSFLIFIESN